MIPTQSFSVGACVFVMALPCLSSAATFAITSSAPNNSVNDAVGNGTWVHNNHPGTWTLISTTGSVGDFRNGALAGGGNGLQYTTNQDWSHIGLGNATTLG